MDCADQNPLTRQRHLSNFLDAIAHAYRRQPAVNPPGTEMRAAPSVMAFAFIMPHVVLVAYHFLVSHVVHCWIRYVTWFAFQHSVRVCRGSCRWHPHRRHS